LLTLYSASFEQMFM